MKYSQREFDVYGSTILTVFGAVVTLTFALLTLESKEIVYVPKCIIAVTSASKFPQAVYEMLFPNFWDARTHVWTDHLKHKVSST